MKDLLSSPTRRQLLAMIGKTAGATAMYQAMTALGFASESSFKQEIELKGAPAGASIVILGAGLGGLTAAYELRKAGYKVTVLEYQNRSGGRSWTLNSGDKYTELGGEEVTCDFKKGNYFNGGPCRLPVHHYAVFIIAKSLMSPCNRLSKPMTALICTVPIILMAHRSAWVKCKAIFAAMCLSYYPKPSIKAA